MFIYIDEKYDNYVIRFRRVDLPDNILSFDLPGPIEDKYKSNPAQFIKDYPDIDFDIDWENY